MKAKINLSIEEKLIHKVKAYAEEHHMSVSELVEQYFQRVVEKSKKKESIIDFVKSLPTVELPYGVDVDLKKQYYEENASKYGF
jgi:hypothetical protein